MVTKINLVHRLSYNIFLKYPIILLDALDTDLLAYLFIFNLALQVNVEKINQVFIVKLYRIN